MRIKKRRLIAGLMVGGAGFAACVANEANTSSTEQALRYTVNGVSSTSVPSVFCGSATVNGAGVDCPALTITADSGDNYVLTALNGSACGSTIVTVDSTGLPAPIQCIGTGTGTGALPVFGSGVSCIPSQYTVNARYLATGPGSAACTITATLENASAPGTPVYVPLNYSGYGNAPTSGITVSPQDIDFGQVTSTSSPVGVTVKNIGTGSVTVNASTAPPYVVNYVSGGGSGSGTSATLGTGSAATAMFNVICASPSAGSNAGTLTFTPSGGGAAQTVALHCTASSSTLVVNPSPVSFGSVVVHSGDAAIPVNISSSSGSDTITGLQLEAGSSPDVSIDGAIAVGGGSGVFLGSGGYGFNVHYDPMQPHTGSLGRIEIHTMSSNTVRYVEIAGTALNAKVAAAPNSIDFGPVCAGTTKTQDFEVYAEAEGAFTLTHDMQPDQLTPPFSVTGPSADMLLEGNHANAAMFTATLTAGPDLGEQSSMLRLHTNLPAALTSTLDVPMHATVLAAGVSPTPGAVDFGANPIDAPTFARMVTLTNCNAATKITSVRITGADATEFALIDPANPLVEIEQFGKLDLRLLMYPKSPGAKVAQLEVEYEGGTAPLIVQLDGTAFGASDGAAGDLGTYYTCSAGGAAGALPVGLALFFARRRRRRQA